MLLSDDFSGFVDTCGTGKRNRAGALVLGNGSIDSLFYELYNYITYNACTCCLFFQAGFMI